MRQDSSQNSIWCRSIPALRVALSESSLETRRAHDGISREGFVKKAAGLKVSKGQEKVR